MTLSVIASSCMLQETPGFKARTKSPHQPARFCKRTRRSVGKKVKFDGGLLSANLAFGIDSNSMPLERPVC